MFLLLLQTALAASPHLGPDDARIYLAGRIPITGVGGTNSGLTFALLDLAPVSFEYRFAPRWNLRLQPSVSYELNLAGPSRLLSESLQVSMPCYFGDRAIPFGMVGYYAGPFVTGGVGLGSVQASAGAVGGYSGVLSKVARYRAGAWFGLAVQPATAHFVFDYGAVVEFGALF